MAVAMLELWNRRPRPDAQLALSHSHSHVFKALDLRILGGWACYGDSSDLHGLFSVSIRAI